MLRPNATKKKMLGASRSTTALAGIVDCVMAILINSSGAWIPYIVYFAYSMRGALFVIILLGIYYKGFQIGGAVYGIIVTAAVETFWVVFNAIADHFPIHPAISETCAAVVAVLLATLIFIRITHGKKIHQTQNIAK